MLLDLTLSCLVAVLLYQLVTQVLSGPLASNPSSIYLIIDHADAVDFSLAAMAIVRLLVARYGGEEFVVVLADTTADAALEVAKRLIVSIERLQIMHPRCPLGCVTVSIGIATQTLDIPVDPVALLEEADRALYRAKSNGRNRYEVAGDTTSDPTPTSLGVSATDDPLLT